MLEEMEIRGIKHIFRGYLDMSAGLVNIGEPYSMNNPPDYIKNIPKGAQRIFIRTFNSVYAQSGSDDQARQAGWTQVKSRYVKKGNVWVKK